MPPWLKRGWLHFDLILYLCVAVRFFVEHPHCRKGVEMSIHHTSKKLARRKRLAPNSAGVANPGYIAAMRELRRSSAAGSHTPKARKGTRRARELSAIKDSLR